MKLADYSIGCHGIPARCFKIKGRHMPFCARCMGASIGHLSCAGCYLFFTLPSVYFSLAGLAFMGADWLSQNKWKLYHSNLLRLVTGIAGGFAVGMIVWTIVDRIIQFAANG